MKSLSAKKYDVECAPRNNQRQQTGYQQRPEKHTFDRFYMLFNIAFSNRPQRVKGSLIVAHAFKEWLVEYRPELN